MSDKAKFRIGTWIDLEGWQAEVAIYSLMFGLVVFSFARLFELLKEML